MPNYTTLFQVIPPLDVEDDVRCRNDVENIKEFLAGHGRKSYTMDEVCFIMLLDNYIKVFEKAKNMIGRNRFTVQFMNYQSSETPDIDDFSIIPIKEKIDTQ